MASNGGMQACSASRMANNNEQTPLTFDPNPDADLINTSSSDGYSCPVWRWNRACIAALSAVITALVLCALMVTAAQKLPDIKCSYSSKEAALEIHLMDVLQWSILVVTFILSVASFCMATTNSKKICHNSGIITTILNSTPSAQNLPSDDATKLKAMQQHVMLSLAILVCNYADLFVMVNQYMRRYNNSTKYLNQHHAFIFPALKVSSNQMLDGINKAFATGLTREITSSLPDAKEQFTLFTAHLLDAASNHQENKHDIDKWGKRDIIEGNERLLVQMMSYLTNNNDCIGGEAAVNPVLNRIDGLLDVHLHLLEQQH